MKIIRRGQAKAAGLMRYFTGEPCVRGHLAERETVSGYCVTCGVSNYAAFREKNIEHLRQYDKMRVAGKRGTVAGCAIELHKRIRYEAKKYRYETDVTPQWIEREIQLGLAGGYLTLGQGPAQPSVDQIIAGLGYLDGNVRIVPLWYNYAKRTWSDEELEAAVTAWYAKT